MKVSVCTTKIAHSQELNRQLRDMMTFQNVFPDPTAALRIAYQRARDAHAEAMLDPDGLVVTGELDVPEEWVKADGIFHSLP